MELPSEAMQINGEYLEELIPGYRTLSVSGREALSPEIESYHTVSGTVQKEVQEIPGAYHNREISACCKV